MSAVERFLDYVKYDTTSEDDVEQFPSTKKQLVLLEKLYKELQELGLDAKMDENGYVYASLKANEPSKCSLCFIAHVDTSPAVSGKDIKTSIVEYKGGKVKLEHGEIEIYNEEELLGKHLIVTDGTTLLGADDKAGVAEIMGAIEYLVEHKEVKHGELRFAFTPDEEVGRGVDFFDVKNFGADFGYTIDGGKVGEIEYENFNAAAASVKINGVSIHPGSAKGIMKNAIDIFAEFHLLLPVAERPNNTEKYEGFYMADVVNGSVDSLTAKYIIRDHDKEKFEKKKEFFLSVAEKINKKYGNVVEVKLKDSYYNMSEVIKDHYHLIDNAKKAFANCGVEPLVIPIRGGTDGARLSFMGLPCPNLSTGGYNFHGKHEFIPVESLEKMVEVILNLIQIYRG